MSSKRIAISSLLCEDTPSGPPPASPSHSSPSRTPNQMIYEPSTHSAPSAFASVPNHTVPPSVPLTRTPPHHPASSYVQPVASPFLQPIQHRRSFREVAFDGCEGPIPNNGAVSLNNPSSHTVPADAADRSTRERMLRTPPDHSKQTLYPPWQHEQSFNPEPSIPVRSPGGYTEQRYPPHSQSSHSFTGSPPQPSVLTQYSTHSRTPQSPTIHKQAMRSHYTVESYRTSPSTTSERRSTDRSSLWAFSQNFGRPTLSPAFPDQHAPYVPPIQEPPRSPVHSPTHSHPALSTLLTQSPSRPRSSAASLPHILNSPISQAKMEIDPKKLSGPGVTGNSAVVGSPPMGGLEALMEAASRERRRMSGSGSSLPLRDDGEGETPLPENPSAGRNTDHSPGMGRVPLPPPTYSISPRQPLVSPPSWPPHPQSSGRSTISPSLVSTRPLEVVYVQPRDQTRISNQATGESAPSVKLQKSVEQMSDSQERPATCTSPALTSLTEGITPLVYTYRIHSPPLPPATVLIGPGVGLALPERRVTPRPEKLKDQQEIPNERGRGLDAKAQGSVVGHDKAVADPYEWLLHQDSGKRGEAYASQTPVVVSHNHLVSSSLKETEGKADSANHSADRTKPSSPDPASASQSNQPQSFIVDTEFESILDVPPVKPKGAARPFAQIDLDAKTELLSLVDDRPSRLASSMERNVPRYDPISMLMHEHIPMRGLIGPGMPAEDLETQLDREDMPPPPLLMVNQEREREQETSVQPKEIGGKKKENKTTSKKMAASKQRTKPTATKRGGKASATATERTNTPSGTPTPSASSTSLAVPPSAITGRVKKSSATSGTTVTAKRAVEAVVSRSRSTSAMPAQTDQDKAKGDDEASGEEDKEDERVYCVCKTHYDEDRVMIACDLCDEWYHTQCVSMPDLEVDLVDQFICPICVANNPTLSLKTTYKRRCHSGLQHVNPASLEACHKPARGAFSKYCSDECGVQFMRQKIRTWAGKVEKSGKDGIIQGLWEQVKEAERREGVVVKVLGKSEALGNASKGNHLYADLATEIVRSTKTKTQREIQRLESALQKISSQREVLKKTEELLIWREKLVEVATERAERKGECGWDQRLCFDEEEVRNFGGEVFVSYNNEKQREREHGGEMQVDEEDVGGEWWCRGKKKCDRHSGWQKLRLAEMEAEREVLEARLDTLATRERDIRRRMEDAQEYKSRLVVSENRQAGYLTSTVVGGPLSSIKPHINGTKVNEDAKEGKKGKRKRGEPS